MERSVSSSDRKRIATEAGVEAEGAGSSKKGRFIGAAASVVEEDLLAEIVRSDLADGVFGFCEDPSAAARRLCLCSTGLRDAVEFRCERQLRTIYQAYRNRMDATFERRVRDPRRLDTALTRRRPPVPLPHRYRLVAATSRHLYRLEDDAAQQFISVTDVSDVFRPFAKSVLSPSKDVLVVADDRINSTTLTRVWDVEAKQCIAANVHGGMAVAILFVGNRIALCTTEGVQIWSVNFGALLRQAYTGRVDSAVSLGDGKTVLCGAISGKIFLINVYGDEDNNQEPLELSPTGIDEFTGSHVVAACRRKWAIVRKSSITGCFDENQNFQCFKINRLLAVHDLEKKFAQQHVLKVERFFTSFFPLPNEPHKFLAHHGNEWVLFELSEEGILSQKPSFRSSCGVMLTGARPLLFFDDDDGGSVEIRCAETTHRSLRLPPGHKALLPSDGQIVTNGKELLVGLTERQLPPGFSCRLRRSFKIHYLKRVPLLFQSFIHGNNILAFHSYRP